MDLEDQTEDSLHWGIDEKAEPESQKVGKLGCDEQGDNPTLRMHMSSLWSVPPR